MEGLISVRAYTWRDLYLRGPTVGIKKQFKTCYGSADQNTFCINLVFNKLQKFIMNWIHFNTFGTEGKGGLYLGCVCVCVCGEGGLGLYATSTFPIMHLICPPKFCITFFFYFSCVLQPSQEKLQTILRWNFEGLVRCKLWEMWSGVSWDVFFCRWAYNPWSVSRSLW